MILDEVQDIQTKKAGGAIISDDGVYRYLLWRVLPECNRARRALFIMLNPSTADGFVNDHTVRKGLGFCQRWDVGVMMFMNAFALRSRDPGALLTHSDPIGPHNDAKLLAALSRKDGFWRVIVAWGNHDSVVKSGRAAAVAKLVTDAGHKVWCLGTNKDGSPRHPLTLAYATELVPWSAA